MIIQSSVQLNIPDLVWNADFCGDEMGHDDVLVAGVYSSEELDATFTIDMETGRILNVYTHEEDE